MKLWKVSTLPVSSVKLTDSSTVECLCGMTRRKNRECSFCGRGSHTSKLVKRFKMVQSPRTGQLIRVRDQRAVQNRYELVDANEITPVPKGDSYMER